MSRHHTYRGQSEAVSLVFVIIVVAMDSTGPGTAKAREVNIRFDEKRKVGINTV